jgi:hypothetical protein
MSASARGVDHETDELFVFFLNFCCCAIQIELIYEVHDYLNLFVLRYVSCFSKFCVN